MSSTFAAGPSPLSAPFKTGRRIITGGAGSRGGGTGTGGIRAGISETGAAASGLLALAGLGFATPASVLIPGAPSDSGAGIRVGCTSPTPEEAVTTGNAADTVPTAGAPTGADSSGLTAVGKPRFDDPATGDAVGNLGGDMVDDMVGGMVGSADGSAGGAAFA